MAPSIHRRPYVQALTGPVLQPCAPHAVLSRLGEKWTILVMSLLAIAPGRRLRFSALRTGIPGISQGMLTLTLRNLERDGLLVRLVFPDVPPRVEYEPTALGHSMLPALEGFTAWISSNWPEIEAERQSYDERKPRG